ncbi:MAG: sugar porter family MFS transporter [Cyclobacteriaceae bacterium]|nr:sugar porter family MFS transporter [Cyclobacteriaceae bacterium]
MTNNNTKIKQNKSLVIVIAAIAATGGLLFGFDTGVISGAIPFFKDFWALTDKQVEWIATAGLIGAIIGAAFSGRITDLIGRKKVIIAAAVIFGIGALWTGWADTPTSLFAGRLFLGLAIGVSSYAVPMYIAEISPTKQRGALVSAFQLLITIGILVSYLSDLGFADENDMESWRPMFLVGVIPAIILFIGMFTLPETPRFLIGKGREEQGRRILKRLEEPELVEPAIDKMKKEIALDAEAGKSWKDIFAPWLRTPLFIAIGIMFVQQFVGINTVIYYSPVIFENAGFASKTAAIAASVSVGAVNVLFTIVAMTVIDRVGRRKLYFIGTAGIAFALVALAISFAFQESLGDMAKWFTVGFVLLYIIFFAVSLGPLGWLIISEIFPLKLRGVGMSIGALSNWLFNAIVTFTFLSLINFLTATGAFLLYAVVGVVGLIWGYRYIPETKGITLEEIEEHWRKGTKPIDIK